MQDQDRRQLICVQRPLQVDLMAECAGGVSFELRQPTSVTAPWLLPQIIGALRFNADLASNTAQRVCPRAWRGAVLQIAFSKCSPTAREQQGRHQ